MHPTSMRRRLSQQTIRQSHEHIKSTCIVYDRAAGSKKYAQEMRILLEMGAHLIYMRGALTG